MAEAARSNKAALVAMVGAPAAAIALMLTHQWEGEKLVGYRDIIGVVTACGGVTGPDAVLGKRYTKAQCDDLDSQAILAHARPVLACTPTLRGKQHALGAAISLTYNIGAPAYCRSTIAVKFNAGDIRGGCDGFPAWNKAGGKVVRGLVNRRAAERAECLKDAS
jgi:lysozyme